MDSTALALTLVGFGVMLIALSYQRHRHGRDVAALGHGSAGALLFLSGTVLFALALNFNTYDKLTPDEPLAELSIEQSGPQTYQVRLMRIPAGDLQVFTLKGDHWQMQAQLLQWRGWTRWLGLDANIRLEQLRSSTDTPAKKGEAAPTKTITSGGGNNYQLSHNPGVSLWDLQHQYPEQLSTLSTQALRTAANALQDGMRFHIELSHGTLTARIINQPTSARRPNAPLRNAPVVSYRGISGLLSSGAVDADESAADSSPTEPNAAPPPTAAQ